MHRPFGVREVFEVVWGFLQQFLLVALACILVRQAGHAFAPKLGLFSTAESDFVAGFCTVNNHTNAKEIAKKLVAEKLVGCVNVVPSVSSIYRWEGNVVEDTEALMMIKTRRSLKSSVTSFIKQQHQYTVPEVIFTPIQEDGSNSDYLEWLRSATSIKTEL
mmetsp:Transcript_12732/g.24531  ORF Transcript_12732/g.24531 Transcript_12732/m.24531 type:complete len:161 (-) Transcript_12732:328-810(-)